MTRLELGELYYTQGGVLERRVVGSILYMAQQIYYGGYPDPTQAQTDFATAVITADYNTIASLAKKALQWGLVLNVDFQAQGVAISDNDLDYIIGEYAKVYTA